MNWFCRNSPSLGSPQVAAVVLDQTLDGVLLLDAENRIGGANDRFWSWTSFPPGSLSGRDAAALWDDASRWTDWMTGVKLGAGVLGTEFLDLKTKDGDLIPVEAQMTRVPGAWGRSGGFVLVLHDLRTLKMVEKLVREDALTGVPSRATLVPRLSEELSRVQRYGTSVGLVLLDIDGFRGLNDRWGPDFGDEVLRVVGAELRDVAGPLDFLGRYGGEEFLMVLPQSSLGRAADVAEELRGNLEGRLFSPHGTFVRVTASFGVTVARPKGHDTLTSVLARVEEALDEAKTRGRNRVEVSP